MAASPEDVLDIRTLIPDTDAIYGPSANENLFSDVEIGRFFRLGGNNALRGAGLAMIAVGNSESLISKVIVTQDLETDGAKAQKEWREAGMALLKRADIEEALGVNDVFELIDYKQGWEPVRPELTSPPWDGRWPYGFGL